MLIKLTKHELIATYRSYLTIFVGALALSVLMGLSSAIDVEEMLSFVFVLAFLGFFIGAIVVLIIQNIKMYTSDLYSARGYLTLTLPAPTWMLLLSKIIVMLIWYILTSIVFITSFIIFFYIFQAIMDLDLSLYEMIKYVFEYLKLSPYVYVLIILSSITGLFKIITMVGLAATSVSTGWINKGKWAVAVVFYFVLNYFTNYISVMITRIMNLDLTSIVDSNLYYRIEALGLSELSETFAAQSWLSICLSLAFGILAYLATVWLIDNKIEIE